jgi:hypothetical protein
VSRENSDDDVLGFTPSSGFVGDDQVTLHLEDSEGAQVTQTITLTWHCVLPEDVDDSGFVDIGDVQFVAARWRTSCADPDPDDDPGTPNYEAQYDLDGNCRIDVVDIMQVVAQWGETCP